MWMATSEVRSHTLHIHIHDVSDIFVYPFGQILVTFCMNCFSRYAHGHVSLSVTCMCTLKCWLSIALDMKCC